MQSGGFQWCAAAGLLSCICGCAVEAPMSLRRVWMDYNTLKTPAIYYDRIHHLPLEAPRVKQMRWMYGHPPIRTDLSVPNVGAGHAGETPAPMKLPNFAGTNHAEPRLPPLLVPLPKDGGKGESTAVQPESKRTPPSSKPVLGPTADRRALPARRTAAKDGKWRFLRR